MPKSDKTIKILALSATAAVGLSATAIVLLQQSNTSNGAITAVQSALREGVAQSKANVDSSKWIQMACQAGKKCND